MTRAPLLMMTTKTIAKNGSQRIGMLPARYPYSAAKATTSETGYHCQQKGSIVSHNEEGFGALPSPDTTHSSEVWAIILTKKSEESIFDE